MPQQPAGIVEHGRVPVAEPGGEAGRVLDVAEEEGERHRPVPPARLRATRQLGADAGAAAGRALDVEAAGERLDAVAQAAEAGAAVQVGAAGAVVCDLDHGACRRRAARARARSSAPACLTMFASASETT